LGWCEPLPDEVDVEKIVDPEIIDDYADANMGDLEDEIDNVKKQVEGLSEAIQEEVAVVKLEFDNGIVDLKKDLVEKLIVGIADMKTTVDEKLIVSENGLNEEILTLKTELETMKQTIGNLKLALFGMMLVLVLIFYGNLI
jgi:RNase P/RNase MRP subunit POP5